ncbi:MAG: hypothetical protein PHN56_05470, partial [Candidatus Nanoarchaeia archaeon]|nr:hypothetical protein [Candidatus Nanoarchaeia archaeon]
QNIINTGNEVKLIDLEDLQYYDPAEDLGQLIAQFGFNDNSFNIFMKEYKTKDEFLIKRAKIYAEIMIFSDFIWELSRVYKLRTNNVHEEFAKKYTVKSHLNESKRKFNKLKKLKIINKNFKFDFL